MGNVMFHRIAIKWKFWNEFEVNLALKKWYFRINTKLEYNKYECYYSKDNISNCDNNYWNFFATWLQLPCYDVHCSKSDIYSCQYLPIAINTLENFRNLLQ
jgi:hypothetical protein